MKSTFAYAAALLLLLVTMASVAGAQESAQVKQGAALFKENCAMCHGENGQGGEGYANPIWGTGAQIKKFENAAALYEYNQMLMPFNDPTLLNNEQKLAVVAFILANHNVIKRSETLIPARTKSLKIP